MKQLSDTGWQRRGISWLWNADALANVVQPNQVWSMRQFLQAVGHWPDQLPGMSGSAVAVAGLDGCLDLLAPPDAEAWLSGDIKEAILSFQDEYQGDGALVFWLPGGRKRLHTNPASDDVTWRCSAPHSGQQLDFGRLLWGAATEYPRELLMAGISDPVGLFHLRIT